jgi:hypothetical protein
MVYNEAIDSIVNKYYGRKLVVARWGKTWGRNLDITIWRCERLFSLRYRNTENIVVYIVKRACKRIKSL